MESFKNFEDKGAEKMPWTEVDISTAEEMLAIANGYDQNIKWIGRMTRAARKMGFDGYSDHKLSGVREYISHEGGLASQDKRDVEEFLQEERRRLCEEAASDPERAKFIAVGESHD